MLVNYDLTFSIKTFCFGVLYTIFVFDILVRYALLFVSWELAKALIETQERCASAGVKLIAVGIGAPNKARILAERVSSFHLGCYFE